MHENSYLSNHIIEASDNPDYLQSEYAERLSTRESSIEFILMKLDGASKKKLLGNLGIEQKDWEVFESVWMKL